MFWLNKIFCDKGFFREDRVGMVGVSREDKVSIVKKYGFSRRWF